MKNADPEKSPRELQPNLGFSQSRCLHALSELSRTESFPFLRKEGSTLTHTHTIHQATPSTSRHPKLLSKPVWPEPSEREKALSKREATMRIWYQALKA